MITSESIRVCSQTATVDANPPGEVVRIPFADPNTHDHVGFGRLPLPGCIAQGPDGAMYVTVG